MSNTSDRIDAIKNEWGDRLLILGHYYQRANVLLHADELGDSLDLSRKAAAAGNAERIVFCGVHFMAESADLLSRSEQTVYMPHIGAGCPMADMSDLDAVEKAWANLVATGDDWLPIVYVNTSAAIKAFCGRNAGSTCTSSNAARIFDWAFKNGKRIFFLPDEHLGTNTALDMGLTNEEIAIYDPLLEAGGIPEAQRHSARVVVWKGFCIVHTAFTAEQIQKTRELHPDAKIIVHPEVPAPVARRADAKGSTSQIVKYVEELPKGATVIIGTELNLVQSLAEQHLGRVTVKALHPSVCANMSRINEQNLLDLLTDWPARNIVAVPEDIAVNAGLALERMLAC